MKKILLLFVFMLCAPLAMAQDRLVVDGTGDSQKLLRQLGQAFEAANPGTSIVVPDSIGSSGGVKALVKGKTDMARIARPLKDKEKALADDLQAQVFAYSPVVFVANLAEKCVSNLTAEQVGGIFSGTIRNWSELGCQAQKIYVAMREDGDSSRSVVKKKVPEFKAISQYVGKEIYSTPETVQIIAETPSTIGYLPLSTVPAHLQTFAYNGIAPSEANVQDGSYPLVSPFALAWRGELNGLGARFLQFVRSAEGKQVIRAAGVVPASGK